MRSTVLMFVICIAGHILSAQPYQKTVQDAFMISRMVEKFHLQPRPLNDEMSAALFSQITGILDAQHILFTREDMNKLGAWRLKLDDEIRNKQSGFLQLLVATYKQRLSQADTMVDNICKTPFNFSIKEKLTVAEDTTYPADLAATRIKRTKLLKLATLNSITTRTVFTNNTKPPAKKLVDSLEPVYRKSAAAAVKRSLKRIAQNPAGIETMIGNLYCQSLAAIYDPHTAYFPPQVKDAFESRLGKKPLGFGLDLDEDEDGNVAISSLKPGSPAFQSGQLNKGDKIQSIQWDKKEPIDVAGASLREINQVLAASDSSKAILSIKKADGTTRQVALKKERLDAEDDDDKVKSFILKGTKTIGYISLPVFYTDWEDNRGLNGCANDVAKEIVKLKKENIEGLVFDLRYNGGGSMQEAIELAGIFIDAGPVAQLKTRDPKVITLKDVNRGTIYDGPLLVLVNGFSASASEVIAATLQDYHRAVIAGSPTYGKATAQTVLPMDTTINLETYRGDNNTGAGSYIKLTISKLYRLNGTTAQSTGVKPDILLPDVMDAQSEREADEKYAIPYSAIEPNKYYKPLPPLSVSAAADLAVKEIAAPGYFKTVVEYNNEVKAASQQKDLSLFLEDAWQERKKMAMTAEPPEPETATTKPAAFIVTTHAYEQQRLKSNPVLQEMQEAWKYHLLEDPYIRMAYQLLTVIK